MACVIECPAGAEGRNHRSGDAEKSGLKSKNLARECRGQGGLYHGSASGRVGEKNVPRSSRRRAAPEDPGNGRWAIRRSEQAANHRCRRILATQLDGYVNEQHGFSRSINAAYMPRSGDLVVGVVAEVRNNLVVHEHQRFVSGLAHVPRSVKVDRAARQHMDVGDVVLARVRKSTVPQRGLTANVGLVASTKVLLKQFRSAHRPSPRRQQRPPSADAGCFRLPYHGRETVEPD